VHEDIRIIGLARDEVDDTEQRWKVPFIVSPEPDSEWRGLFPGCYDRVKSTMYRRAHVAGSRIILEAPVDEVTQYHLPQLERAVKETNEKYRDRMAQLEETSRKRQRELDKRKDDLSKTLDDIETELDSPRRPSAGEDG
jgi:hypothetical protein